MDLARSSSSSSDQSSLATRARDWTLDTISGLSSNFRGLDRSRTPSCSSFESCSTEATSVTSEEDYTRVGNHLVVPSGATTSYYKFTQDQVYLQKDVEGQLCDVLKKDHVYFVWLRLVGRTPDNIRPAMVLATSEIRTKRAIIKFLRKASFMPRLRDCRLDLHVILSSSGAACNFDGEKQSETLPMVDPEIIMHISQHSLGNALTIRSRQDREQRRCVAGGTVIADGQLWILAPNHTHQALVEKRSLWRTATTSISSDEISYEDNMPFSIWSDEHDDIELWQTCPQDTERSSDYVHQFSLDSNAHHLDSSDILSASSSTDIHSRLTMAAKSASPATPSSTTRPSEPSSHDASSTQDHGVEITRKLEVEEMTSVPLTVQSQSEAADWMALELDSDSDGWKYFIPTVNEVDGYVIDEVFDWSSERSVPVTLAMPTGEITGYLQVGSVLYRVGETLYDLRCVALDQPLKRGCSGTWVTHKNQLYGVIIAINDNEPEVFILPFHYVIKDIERVLQCRVQLPTTNLEPPACAASGSKPSLRDTGSLSSVGQHSTLPPEPYSVSGYSETSQKEQANLPAKTHIPCRPPPPGSSRFANRPREIARLMKSSTQPERLSQLEDAIHKRTIADEGAADQSLSANNLATQIKLPEDGELSREALFSGCAQADPRLVADIENPDVQSSTQHELPSFGDTWPETEPRAHASRYTTCRSSLRRSTEDYTVGWICALPLELALAAAILDEVHEDPPPDHTDTNPYTLGHIGDHNVVIACLPAGQKGINHAAAVVMQTNSRFTSIRFGLPVGIGGGVPSTDSDIRLGDLVVIQPHIQHGQVMQYDIRRTEAGGHNTRTGFLSTHLTALLNTFIKVQANCYKSRSSLYTSLLTFDVPLLFCHQNTKPDILFQLIYNHSSGGTYEYCSKGNIVKRALRMVEVVFHSNTIASSNQVMKHGITRDRLNAEHDVLCSEMEAAGLVESSFPCLVIRGICDYAKSHKNKRWRHTSAHGIA